jgi:hypothetical protein
MRLYAACLEGNGAIFGGESRSRIEQQREKRPPAPRYPEDYLDLEPGFIKPAGLAWYASHHHTADGLNQPYQYPYLFAYSIPSTDSHSAGQQPDPNSRYLGCKGEPTAEARTIALRHVQSH